MVLRRSRRTGIGIEKFQITPPSTTFLEACPEPVEGNTRHSAHIVPTLAPYASAVCSFGRTYNYIPCSKKY